MLASTGLIFLRTLAFILDDRATSRVLETKVTGYYGVQAKDAEFVKLAFVFGW